MLPACHLGAWTSRPQLKCYHRPSGRCSKRRMEPPSEDCRNACPRELHPAPSSAFTRKLALTGESTTSIMCFLGWIDKNAVGDIRLHGKNMLKKRTIEILPACQPRSRLFAMKRYRCRASLKEHSQRRSQIHAGGWQIVQLVGQMLGWLKHFVQSHCHKEQLLLLQQWTASREKPTQPNRPSTDSVGHPKERALGQPAFRYINLSQN